MSLGLMLALKTFWSHHKDFMCALLKGVSVFFRKNVRGILVIALLSVVLIVLLMILIESVQTIFLKSHYEPFTHFVTYEVSQKEAKV